MDIREKTTAGNGVHFSYVRINALVILSIITDKGGKKNGQVAK